MSVLPRLNVVNASSLPHGAHVGESATPSFAIGQRALLLRHPEGNVLWDCLTYFDDATVAEIERLGGVSAMAISHPHYYSTMVEWADQFDMPTLGIQTRSIPSAT